ncbi:type II toxin-antitoxin system RelE/ParE family toxin [Mesorhizobium sp. ASY16-5R]|uniref:type II toxin-antitoxin system RelE/ParE family toxin n=1 Tax=Mesorhizobium sp. ASY16-5R TaxID=3445772 RepID=UPI003FA0680A
MPYIWSVQTVLLTPTFQKQADRAGLADDEIVEIAAAIAADPLAGDVMVGTGGARKMRHAGRGHGKSGGYRTIHYFGGDDVPVFLLAIYGKGQKDNLSQKERNALATILPQIADQYRRDR